MELTKYSFGVGDRFARQGKAQLQAIINAKQAGISVSPVWNKSYREHSIISTSPKDVRAEADAAVKELKYDGPYFVDADHINLRIIDDFLEPSDFFTLDVAEDIGSPAPAEDLKNFLTDAGKFIGSLKIPGIEEPFEITHKILQDIADKYLAAAIEASKIYEYLITHKQAGTFVTEVSMDETDAPQTPVEMFFILFMLARLGVKVQTIAPKFTGRFNKGVDYVGDPAVFEKEFYEDVKVLDFAVKEFALPQGLKLSVHSGSDKFSIYEPIKKTLAQTGAGIHVKTAGTTWLEEIIGLASVDGQGLELAKKIYSASYDRLEELTGPYATVIDIDRAALPAPDVVNTWTARTFVKKLTHNPDEPLYDINARQLLHVSYKVAVELGDEFLSALDKYETEIARHVTENILERHIKRIFPAG